MTAFRTKWDDWNIPDTPKCRTDITDTKAVVSDVSAALGHIQPEKSISATETPICGQCAVIVKEGQEFLHVVADGFPGVIHLDCYDTWYEGHILGR
jgi:hypothetical protein